MIQRYILPSYLGSRVDVINPGNVSELARVSGWTRKRVRRGIERLKVAGSFSAKQTHEGLRL